MKFTELPLKGAYTIDLEKMEDDRGFFARSWCMNEFAEHGLDINILQINNSFCKQKGTLRGLHFQCPPKAESKIVRCIKGSLWDVIVDLRENSNTYAKWSGVELNAINRTMIYVPKGFAHGFISLTKNTEVIYMATELYSPDLERVLRWDDDVIGIKWPIEPVIISKKDSSAMRSQENKSKFKLLIK